MSEDFQSYPYSGNYITLSDAVIFICAVVYPQVARDKAEKLKARKRVRERICQAGKDGIFLQFIQRALISGTSPTPGPILSLF